MSNTAAAAMNALAELAKNGHLGALEKLCQLAHVRDPSTGANFAPASDTTEKSQSGGGGAAKTATTKPSGGAAKTNPHGAIAPPSTYAKTTCDGAKAAAFAAKQNTKAAAEAEAKAAVTLSDLNKIAAKIIEEFLNKSKDPTNDSIKIMAGLSNNKKLTKAKLLELIKKMLQDLKNCGLKVRHYYNRTTKANWLILKNPVDPRRSEETSSKIHTLVKAMHDLNIPAKVQCEFGFVPDFAETMEKLQSFGHTSCHEEEDEDGDEHKITTINCPIYKLNALLKFLQEEVDCHIFPNVAVEES